MFQRGKAVKEAEYDYEGGNNEKFDGRERPQSGRGFFFEWQ
jgi:hypothetical protein